MSEDHNKKYQPGMAQLDFKPDFDWSREQAEKLYNDAEFEIHMDHIEYLDCVAGMENLPNSSVDLVIADPPFGIDFDKIGSQYNRNEKFVVEGYNEIEMNYDQFTHNWIKQLPRIMKNTASAYIFSGWTNLTDVLNAVEKAGLTLMNHIIWKYQFGVFTRKKYVTSHYHVLFLVKDEDQYFFNKIIHYPEDVWEIPRTYRPGQKKNSTKLPEKVVTRCIDFSSKPGDLILDPFMGNGTTAVCAKGSHRHFYGFELNKNLKEIIEKNLKGTSVGQFYKPYITYKPSSEELAEKYPAVRRHLKKQKREEGHKNLTEFL